MTEIFRRGTGYDNAMDPGGKLAFLADSVISRPSNFIVAASGVFFIAGGLLRRGPDLRAISAAAVLAFLLAGALLPSPSWYQYFMPLMATLVFGAVYGMAAMFSQGYRVPALLVFVPVVFLSMVFGRFGPDKSLPLLRETISRPGSWIPVKIHVTGERVRSLSGPGKVLTLAPVVPLEGGAGIYREFASGPFGWRTGHLLSPGERKKYSVVSPGGLAGYLEGDEPAGILTGFEDDAMERPMTGYAENKGYLRHDLGGKIVLWERRRATL